MASRFAISQFIVEEIAAATDDQNLRLLAQQIIEYELENWRKERPRFVASYEALIERTVRRRQKSRED
jgi:hypothetical protein